MWIGRGDSLALLSFSVLQVYVIIWTLSERLRSLTGIFNYVYKYHNKKKTNYGFNDFLQPPLSPPPPGNTFISLLLFSLICWTSTASPLVVINTIVCVTLIHMFHIKKAGNLISGQSLNNGQSRFVFCPSIAGVGCKIKYDKKEFEF